MADKYTLNNYSDDAQIKRYISDVLMPRVFKDIPLNILNTGSFSIINEYMSQAIENLAFTASFYHNESFITKAMLADSIYSEAAIFNIGYSYATPSCCNFMLELRIKDLMANSTFNSDNGLYEFILDKNTKFNLSNGSVYSLDYDILIQYKSESTATIQSAAPAWNVQYINMDQMNSVAVNKDPYILYRVSETWLCLFVKASEYERETHIVVNNMTNGIPNEDALITCTNHIAGFDIKYIDGSGNEEYIPHDHILPIHSDVKDQKPYVHYIMDSPKTIRFMFQLNGTRYFVPKLNSSYEITVYTCHGEAANFSSFKTDEQPGVITSSSKYSNNGNVMKAAFVISPSMAGTNIGTIETTRRETIEAYNTANVISSDHDIEEWFNTFHFKNVLYPFFFKRRDDPWGRIWSGYIALKDSEDNVFRTNTLHAKIPYQYLYTNDDGSGDLYSTNEIIIPPGLVWLYTKDDGKKYTVTPLLGSNGKFETAKTGFSIGEKFIFANPFGIRIQKDPFAIGYFNPWINSIVTATNIPLEYEYSENETDRALIYHATPTLVQVTRNFVEDFYRLKVIISPSTRAAIDGTPFTRTTKAMIVQPQFNQEMWNFFEQPSELYEVNVPVLVQNPKDKYILFDPEHTYMCVRKRDIDAVDASKIILSDFWIEQVDPITNVKTMTSMNIQGYDKFVGTSDLWGANGVCMQDGNRVEQTDDTTITISGIDVNGETDSYQFVKLEDFQRYEFRLKDPKRQPYIRVDRNYVKRETYHLFNEGTLWRIGIANRDVNFILVDDNHPDGISITIANAQYIDIPIDPEDVDANTVKFDFSSINASEEQPAILVYAKMKPIPSQKSILYTRVPFSTFANTPDKPMFTMVNTQIPLDSNVMRVILETRVNGNTNGWLEMIPKTIDADGSVEFEAIMNPLNKLVGSDNRIRIASTERGGGAWIPTTSGGDVVLDAISPDIKISILFKSDDEKHPSEVLNENSTYIGYRLQDMWKVNDLSLIQELKEMRSVVKFGENHIPSQNEIDSFNEFYALCDRNSDQKNLIDIQGYALNHDGDIDNFMAIKQLSAEMLQQLGMILHKYTTKYQINNLTIVNGGENYGNDLVRIEFADGSISKGVFMVDGYNINMETGPAWNIVPLTNVGIDVDWDSTIGSITVDYEDIDWDTMTNGGKNNTLRTNVISSTGEGTNLTVSIKQSDVTGISSIPAVDKQPVFIRLRALLLKVTNVFKADDITDGEWDEIAYLIGEYPVMLSNTYASTSVDSSIEIQLVPFVQHTLMNSEKFDEFVASFTQIHTAIEPVIFKRLEGNNYLDCKLIATYGYPHTYASDVNKKVYDLERKTTGASVNDLFWPSLDVQLEFDVHLFNPAMETITFKEIRNIIKSYFNRLTSIHTPVDMISMDNNIYISQLIQQLESHPNVAYLKFKGWYTNEKNELHGNYMNADYQCIVQMWDKLEDFPTQELERYVPEMFVLDDASIVLNSI